MPAGRREQTMKRRLQVRIDGHRQPVNYNPSTGKWTLTWEDKKHSGTARTAAEARDMIRKLLRKYS
jgi:hypothetical protein